jgi:hypothetical protein
MEFDELQRIWDSQNNKPLYAINEAALHSRIHSKRKRATHTANFSEVLLIIVNISAGCVILGMNASGQSHKLSLYFLAAWMLGSALYLLMSRLHRIKSEKKFDRSLRGELNQAISAATYQVRLSQLMRLNILPIGIILLFGIWEGSKSVWVAVAMLIFFVVANYAGGWEHNIYKARRRELEILQNKLET